jgi:hypothetical protein
MNDLTVEAAQVPDSAIRFAKEVGWVRTPEYLVPLRTMVRTKHPAGLAAVHDALDERFGHTNADFVNVFRAAAEMAVMEQVSHNELDPKERRLLRSLWEALLNAK